MPEKPTQTVDKRGAAAPRQATAAKIVPDEEQATLTAADPDPVADEGAPSSERLLDAVPAEAPRLNQEPQGPKVVTATSSEGVTLDSGASFVLVPGQSYTVSPDDAKALIDQGLAVEG